MAAFAILAFELVTRRIERGATEEEIILASSNPRLIAAIRKGPNYMMGIVGITSVALWVFFGERFRPGLSFGLMICWLILSGWVFAHPTIRERHSEAFRLFAQLTPAIAILFYSLGFDAARAQLDPARPMDDIEIKSSQGAPLAVRVHVLRGFEQWLLVQDANKRVAWIRSSNVLRIEAHQDSVPFRGVGCSLIRALCISPVAQSIVHD